MTRSGSSSAIARRRGLAAVGLADELHAVARLDGARHPRAEHEAVVDDEDADRTGALRAPSGRSSMRARARPHDGPASPRWPTVVVATRRRADGAAPSMRRDAPLEGPANGRCPLERLRHLPLPALPVSISPARRRPP